jgi:hypothetical protein
MKTIFKYDLPIQSNAQLLLPAGAQILSVQSQRGSLCLWALVETEAKLVERRFAVFGTGHKIPADRMTFLGTAQFDEGALVFHVFECRGVW